jgi:hypothetical protein
MWIMIAGPYTSGAADEAERSGNLAALNRAALSLFRSGHVPIISVNLALPIVAAAGASEGAFDEITMPLALIERCDACLRIGGPSRGAEQEADRFRATGKPVYHRLDEVPPAT